MTVPDQESVRCVIARGGTSKGLYLRENDVPPAGAARDRLLLRLFGSPDVAQIDGLGGAVPVTSKTAIIGPSTRPDADVDYTFGQIEIARAHVDYTGNCGNISAGVGPFAIDEGLVPAVEPTTTVRIHNTNTGRLFTARVEVAGGRARVDGDAAIPGVPGTGAPILLDYAGTVGAKTGRLLPTGNVVDTLTLSTGATVSATLCDAGNPCVWVPASDVGLTGGETAAQIEGDEQALARLAELRGQAAVAFGLCSDATRAEIDSPALPMIGIVAPPGPYTAPNGAKVDQDEMDLRVRLMFMGRLHPSIAGTASVSLTAASRIDGSVVTTARVPDADDTLRIGHASGVMTNHVTVAGSGSDRLPEFAAIELVRTARRLMEGLAWYPRSVLDETAA